MKYENILAGIVQHNECIFMNLKRKIFQVFQDKLCIDVRLGSFPITFPCNHKRTRSCFKKYIIASFLFLCAMKLFSQTISCGCEECILDTNDLMIAYKEFISTQDLNGETIILIDYIKRDTTSIINVLESNNVYELFYRKPDCYFIDKNNIIYIYTEKYNYPKEEIYLAEVFDNTQKVLFFNERKNEEYFQITGKNKHFKSMRNDIIWQMDSIKMINNIMTKKVVYLFDPVPIQYYIVNNKIINKQYVEKVIFPDVSSPKGINDSQYRMLPYWREDS